MKYFEFGQEHPELMVMLHGGGNVSTCGFSSGGALALGIAAHNSALGHPLSPGTSWRCPPARSPGTVRKRRGCGP